MAIFCILYYVLSLSQSIPCIIKLIRTRSSHDFSLLNRLFQYLALISWTIYLFTIPTTETYLLVIGLIDVGMLTTENILILLFYKHPAS